MEISISTSKKYSNVIIYLVIPNLIPANASVSDTNYPQLGAHVCIIPNSNTKTGPTCLFLIWSPWSSRVRIRLLRFGLKNYDPSATRRHVSISISITLKKTVTSLSTGDTKYRSLVKLPRLYEPSYTRSSRAGVLLGSYTKIESVYASDTKFSELTRPRPINYWSLVQKIMTPAQRY